MILCDLAYGVCDVAGACVPVCSGSVTCGMCFSLILQPETVLDFGCREIVGVFKLNVDSCRALLD